MQIMFDEARESNLSEIYATVYEEQEDLISLLEEYGFEHFTDKDNIDGNGDHREEQVFLKKLDNNSFPNVDWEKSAFIVPIEPKYHRMLFPDAEDNYQLEIEDLKGGNPHSNAIKKAYFTKSNTTLIGPGDLLCFYASHNKKCVTVIGTVDAVFTDIGSAEEAFNIARKRTVYSIDEIKSQFSKSTKLILFKKNKVLARPIPYQTLISEGILKGAPQSITKISSNRLKAVIDRNN